MSLHWTTRWLAVALLAPSGFCVADILNRGALAQQYFPTNTSWFEANVPFMETSDQNIQQVYSLPLGSSEQAPALGADKQHWVFTEFTYPVWWESADRTISAPAAHHINEARWLRDHTYVDSYVDYWMKGYGNPPQYSFWAADAVYQNYLASGNAQMAAPYLAALKDNYYIWTVNRFDASRQMFWQVPLQDATEWSVSARWLATTRRRAYRPTINSYMYASALAISSTQLAEIARTGLRRPRSLKSKCRPSWNPQMQTFMDRFRGIEPEYQFIDSRGWRDDPVNFNCPATTRRTQLCVEQGLAVTGLGPMVANG
jgi:hypothetical protein